MTLTQAVAQAIVEEGKKEITNQAATTITQSSGFIQWANTLPLLEFGLYAIISIVLGIILYKLWQKAVAIIKTILRIVFIAVTGSTALYLILTKFAH